MFAEQLPTTIESAPANQLGALARDLWRLKKIHYAAQIALNTFSEI
jgi:hypothetical protein